MRVVLRAAALLMMGGAGVWWLVAGRNPGWTKNQIFVNRVDEVTGIAWQEAVEGFVPGADLLGVAVFCGTVLWGLSFCWGRRLEGCRKP